MKFTCPNCHGILFVPKETIALVQSLFAKCVANGIGFICDECGRIILSQYRDTYGLGV